jgi:hypothetical protein
MGAAPQKGREDDPPDRGSGTRERNDGESSEHDLFDRTCQYGDRYQGERGRQRDSSEQIAKERVPGRKRDGRGDDA